MSDYDKFYNKELPILFLLLIITFPIWFVIYVVMFIFKSCKEVKIYKIKENKPLNKRKPLIYSNKSEWKKYDT